VPGIFAPVRIGEREYVDGGLTHPVPAVIARRLGAEVVIAVDISSKPADQEVSSTLDVLLQTFTIMGNRVSQYELAQADVVIRPALNGLKGIDFASRNLAILEGERAATAALEQIRLKLKIS
jgi:NTE family protein